MLGRQHDGGDLNFLIQTRTTRYQSPVIHMHAAWAGNKQKLEIHEHPHSYDLTRISETCQDSSHACEN